jgi:putative oxidoreductase
LSFDILLKNKIAYRIAKGFTSAFMLFSAFFSLTHAADFAALGFPNYFRIELSVAKIIGAVILLFPQTPMRTKEWVYAGFGITMLSAFLAHICSGDPLSKILFVGVDSLLFGFAVWTVNRYEDSMWGQKITEKFIKAKP